MNALTERELKVLEIERKVFRYAATKEKMIRDQLGITATRYYQILNALLDNPLAIAEAPVALNRLRRVLDARLSR